MTIYNWKSDMIHTNKKNNDDSESHCNHWEKDMKSKLRFDKALFPTIRSQSAPRPMYAIKTVDSIERQQHRINGKHFASFGTEY